MTIRDTIRKQQEAVKNRTFKEKMHYYWDYYGVKAICIAVAAVVIIAFTVNMLTQKDAGYSAVFFGATPHASAGSYLADFAQAAGIDPNVYELNIQSSLDIRMDDRITEETYQVMQSFAAMVAANMVDNIASDVELYLYYSYLGYTVDLRTVLTESQLTELAPYLHYVDGKLLKEQELSDEGLTFEYGQCPDSKKPEEMTDPIPVGIDLEAATQAFHDSYTFASKAPVFGICFTTERPDAALAYLQYAFGLPMNPSSETE